MHTRSLTHWMHEHVFGQDERKVGERRTIAVIIITAITMIVEIGAGIVFGSMALLADGLHMGSHASALAVSAFAYYYTRRHAKDARFSFGTGKVNSLAAFASAVLLAVFAIVMLGESIDRFFSPVTIAFNQAILVAVLGLLVNGVCLFVLGRGGHSHVHEGHGPAHGHEHPTDAHADHVPASRDLNLWSAQLHVLADALTSLLAIFALLAGKYLAQEWLDPLMGVVGAIMVVRWSWGLIRSSAGVLLDMQAPAPVRKAIQEAVEAKADNRVSDLHAWSVGPGIYAAEIAIVTSEPKTPDDYLELLPKDIGLVHVTVEVHECISRSSASG